MGEEAQQHSCVPVHGRHVCAGVQIGACIQSATGRAAAELGATEARERLRLPWHCPGCWREEPCRQAPVAPSHQFCGLVANMRHLSQSLGTIASNVRRQHARMVTTSSEQPQMPSWQRDHLLVFVNKAVKVNDIGRASSSVTEASL